MKTKNYLLFGLLSLFAFQLPAQSELFVDTTITAEQMVMDFFDGECVTVSNISYNGDGRSKGYFEGAMTDLGIPAGMLLSSGRAIDAIGPSDSPGTSTGFNGDGDPDLENIVGMPTNDAAILEFDLISDSDDTLNFFYAFASEEYNEFVGTNFNDVFAFFVDGLAYPMTNIALLPDGQTPVSINNVNTITNPMYYVNYVENGGIHTEYDGITIELAAPFVVQANETYHIKIAVADVADDIFDSGVFLGIESLCGDSLLTPPAEAQLSMIGNTVYLADLSRYATSYLWDFGDGTTSTERNPAPHNYQQDGYYTISLTTQNYCCSDTWSFHVPVGDVININENTCEVSDYQLDGITPGNGETGQWSVLIGEGSVMNPADSGSALNNPSIGINMLEWRITDQATGDLILTDTFVLNVYENPEASIAPGDYSFCEYDPPVLVESSPAGGIFDGAILPNGNFDPLLAGIGVHSINYTYTDNNGCIDIAFESFYVYAAPEIDFELSSTTYCENDASVQLDASPAGGVFNGPGVVANSFDPQLAGVGNHAISYEYTNFEGCTAIEIVEIQVVMLPVLQIIDLGPICENVNPISLTAIPSGGVFAGPGVSGGMFDPMIAGLGNHVVNYTYTDFNGCSNSTSLGVDVIAAPSTPEIILLGNDSISASIAGADYFWELDGQPLNINAQQIQLQGDGNYTVLILSAEGCFSETSSVFSVTGVFDFLDDESELLEVFPNPANEYLQIRIADNNQRATPETITIYNALGQVVRTINWDRNFLEVDIRDFENGVYYIRAKGGEVDYSGSFLKQ